MPLPLRNPGKASLVAALKTAPATKDNFGGSAFPGSYLWQRGNLDPEAYHANKQAKYAMEPKVPMPKLAKAGTSKGVPKIKTTKV